jgi:hypothetical protein
MEMKVEWKWDQILLGCLCHFFHAPSVFPTQKICFCNCTPDRLFECYIIYLNVRNGPGLWGKIILVVGKYC